MTLICETLNELADRGTVGVLDLVVVRRTPNGHLVLADPTLLVCVSAVVGTDARCMLSRHDVEMSASALPADWLGVREVGGSWAETGCRRTG